MSAPRWFVDHFEDLTGLSPERNRLRTRRALAGIRLEGAVPEQLTTDVLEQEEVAALIDAVTVNESYFFRDRRQLAMLQQEILPGLAASRRGAIKVWSAGCATGEEAYTVAMVATEAGLLPRVNVLGTDLSARAITVARGGRYGTWSMRGVEPGRRHRWFVGRGDVVEPLPAIRSNVRFRVGNLLDGPPGRFDLVLCRNVLMYMTPEAVRRAAEVLAGSLADDGWLLTGASDPPLDDERLVPVRTTLGLAYRPAGSDRSDLEPPSRSRHGAEVSRAVPLPPPLRSEAREAGEGEVVHGPEVGAPSPSDPVSVATTLADGGDVVGALQVVEAALAEDQLDAELHLLAAMLHLEAGSARAALEASRRALYLDHSLAVAHLIQGHVHRLMGDHVRAARSFEKAASSLADLPEDATPPGAHGESAGHLASSALRLAAAERS